MWCLSTLRTAHTNTRTHRAGIHRVQVGHDGRDEAGGLAPEKGDLVQQICRVLVGETELGMDQAVKLGTAALNMP